MEIRIVCENCGAEYKVDSARVKGRPKRFSCKKCSQNIILRPADAGVEVTGGAVKSPFSAEVPTRFGKFHDLSRLASGGMGDIYLAKMGGAEGFEREVVLKVLHPHLARDESFAKALVDEAKLMVLLNHPNIVQVYNLEKTGDLLYCVMEYVPGKSLSSILRAYANKGGAVPVPMAVYIVAEALEGLAYAHDLTDSDGKSLGVVHRDVSPQNILVTRDGWVKLIDFGIAKAAKRITQTAPGMIKGKFAYMAPEQLKGRVDHRADLFAMGVVLWEALAGVRLFHSTTDVDTLQKVLHLEPPAISLTRSSIPRVLDKILEQALAKNPDERYPSARAFKADLMKFMAPATKEDLRSAVDIDASRLPEAPPPTSDDASFADVTPVDDSASVTSSLVGSDAGQRRRPWAVVAVLLLVAGLAVGAVLGLSNLSGEPPAPADAGMVLPPPAPVDAGVVAAPEAADAGTVEKQEEAGTSTPDAGTQVASVEPPLKPKNPGRKRPVKLGRGMIGKVLRRNGATLQRCADAHLGKKGVQADVKLTLAFTIGRSGKVIDAALKPARHMSTDFGRCLLTRVRTIGFPRHRDKSVSISFPLTFQSVKR